LADLKFNWRIAILPERTAVAAAQGTLVAAEKFAPLVLT